MGEFAVVLILATMGFMATTSAALVSSATKSLEF